VGEDDVADSVVADEAAALLKAAIGEVFGDVIPTGGDVVEDFCFGDVVGCRTDTLAILRIAESRMRVMLKAALTMPAPMRRMRRASSDPEGFVAVQGAAYDEEGDAEGSQARPAR